MDEERERFFSTAEQMERFNHSTVWKDLKLVLSESIRQKHIELEETLEVEKIRFIQGEIASLRWMEGLPETVSAELEERIREDSKNLKKEESHDK